MIASFILRLLPLWFLSALFGPAPRPVLVPVRARARRRS